MFDFLLNSIIDETLTLPAMLASLCGALVMGFAISFVYMATHKKEGYSAGFVATLIMLPAIIAVIIMLIGNNVARAFSLAGAFSLVRFRSAPGDPKDIAYVAFVLAIGLSCGLGYIAYGVIFVVILSAIMLVMDFFKFGKPKRSLMQLKITIPEDLNFQGLFDDVLDKYTESWNLKNIKTSDFGTLFELVYIVTINPLQDSKKFIDELRCRNSNLNISLTMKEFEDRYTA